MASEPGDASQNDADSKGPVAGAGPPPVDELIELLVRQHELYRELGRLARAQRDLIAAEDPSALLNLLAQRQKLISQLADINVRLEPARADWKRIESLMTTEQRRQAGRLVEQVGQLLAEILKADEIDSKTLSARKAMIGREIQATAANAQVQAAYRQAAGPIRQPTGTNLDAK